MLMMMMMMMMMMQKPTSTLQVAIPLRPDFLEGWYTARRQAPISAGAAALIGGCSLM